MSFRTSLPPFCTPLDNQLPWPRPLPDVPLVAMDFDEARLQDQDFQRTGIPMPENLQRAVAKRKAEYLAGRLCAREALQQALGVGAVPGTGEDRAPQWPSGSVGSITHSHGKAAAIVAPRHRFASLGLDLEQTMPDDRAIKLTDQILTGHEQQRFAQALAEQPGDFLTLAFSLKETLFKALYPLTLKRFYFEHAELLEWTSEGMARVRLLTDLSQEWRNGQELTGQFVNRSGQLLSLIAIDRDLRSDSF